MHRVPAIWVTYGELFAGGVWCMLHALYTQTPNAPHISNMNSCHSVSVTFDCGIAHILNVRFSLSHVCAFRRRMWVCECKRIAYYSNNIQVSSAKIGFWYSKLRHGCLCLLLTHSAFTFYFSFVIHTGIFITFDYISANEECRKWHVSLAFRMHTRQHRVNCWNWNAALHSQSHNSLPRVFWFLTKCNYCIFTLFLSEWNALAAKKHT